MLKKLNLLGARLSAVAMSTTAIMMAGEALAQTDVDDVVVQSGQQLKNVGDLVNIAAYGGGAVLTATGLLNLKKHANNPSQNNLRDAVGPAVVGVGLLAFPSVAGILTDSTFGETNTNPGYTNNAFDANFGS